MVFSETLVKWKGFSSRLSGLQNSHTELISNLFGPVGNFSIKFCARFEKNSLKLLAMEREQKDKPSFSFRQIFVGGVFVLGRPSFLRFFQSSLGSPIFSSSFFEKNFFFLFNQTLNCVFGFFIYQRTDVKFAFLNFLNSFSLLDMFSKLTIKPFVGLIFYCISFIRSKIIYNLCDFIHQVTVKQS